MTPDKLAETHAAAFDRDRPWTADEFATLLAQESTIIFGDSRSFLLARLVLDEAEILTLATHPAHQRKGLARSALAAFMTRARLLGVTRALLDVAEDNLPARALYTDAGFAEIGRRAAYYQSRARSGQTALVMARDLRWS